ncbi:hypothetical protein NHE_0745 [Neorickettsia helminthoeca str. Oregon]|uniref:Uncharacterized protein n=1 Tax=Neorickettsia helminthoeca str. Oregon TaxID=1286528 RepID=X5GX95_9RICK|nr:hypothetical protein [Neorickettsia helminthoeca]AHX11677.1 hypothetical protein NHE_0745 [Neorickettsia helminthoeca str. Oregon]
MLDKVIIYISGKEITLFEVANDHSNIVSSKTIDLEQLAELINLNNASSYILLDPSRVQQRYFTKDFPFISYININALLQKTILEEKCGHYPLCEYFPISRSANRLCYSFVCSEIEPEIERFISRTGRNFKGIFFPFVEIRQISKKLFNSHNRLQKNNAILVYSAPHSLTVIYLSKEHVPLDMKGIVLEQNTPTSIAGEILQKIEELSLITSNNIVVIATKTINQIIKTEEKLADIFLLTPYEAAILLKIENFFKEDEDRGELLFARNILLNKLKYRTLPRKYAKLEKQYSREKTETLVSVIMFLLSVFSIFFCEIKLNSYTMESNAISKELGYLDIVSAGLKEDLNNYDTQSQEKIKLYKLFQSPNKSPTDYLLRLENQVVVTGLQVEYSDNGVSLSVDGTPQVDEASMMREIKKYYANHRFILNGQVVTLGA